MSNEAAENTFYAPDIKELGLVLCHVLEHEGGCLSLARAAEVVGDVLQIPEAVRTLRRTPPHDNEWVWTYHLAWVCTELRSHGFMERNDSNSWGMCVLTKHGRKLGQWAGRIYDGENPELPEWVAAFLRPLFKRIRRLLNGREHRRPPDYELCRWLRYCYLLDERVLGASLFSLILADNVDPATYRQAERQVRILKLRGEEQEDVSEGSHAPTAESSFQATSGLRKWLTETLPVGSRVPTLVHAGQNEIRAIGQEGLIVVSSRTEREDIVPWSHIEAAYRQLVAEGVVSHQSAGGRSSFLCSLLARLPGVEIIEGQCAVRLGQHKAFAEEPTV